MKKRIQSTIKNKWYTFLIVCIISIAVVFGGYFLYSTSIQGAIYNNTASFMDQLADHDIKNIENTINNHLDYIHSFIDRIEVNHKDNQKDLSYLLGLESRVTSFKRLYVITKKNVVYDQAQLITTLDKMNWKDDFERYSGDFVVRFMEDEREAWSEYILYGYHLEDPVAYQDDEIVGVIGLVPVGEMDDIIHIKSFDGKGEGIVIHETGEIITASQYYDEKVNQNFFNELKDSSIKDINLSDIESSMKNKEDIFIEYQYSNTDYYAIMKPILKNNWYMVVKVPTEINQQQTQNILIRSVFFFVALGGVIVLIAIYIYRIIKNAQIVYASEKAKSTFLANMSHEIRTPLNGIIGLQYLMKQNIDHPERLKEYIDKSEISSRYLKSVITDVLEMSKIESGQLEIYQKPFELSTLIEEVKTIIEIQAEEKHQHFIVDYQFESQQYLNGDELRIKQVLINLLGNALKFTPEGGTIELIIHQSISNNQTQITFVIRDNGCGMTEEFLEKIWVPFEQERRIASQNGTGLGTTLSKILVEKMGGTIDVESEIKKGTTFTVSIPFEIVSYSQSVESNKHTTQETLKGKHILLVEDNELNREILVDILSDEGCFVSEAENGKEAVSCFEESEIGYFDLILMDVQMPVMDGYEATQKIRALPRGDSQSVAIIALTANAFHDDIEKALSCGMNEVITKPLDVAILLKKISDLRGGE